MTSSEDKISTHMEELCDAVASEYARGLIRFSKSDDRMVRAIRYLIETRNYSGVQASNRLGLDKSRSAMSGFCYRTDPKIGKGRSRSPVSYGIHLPERKQQHRKPRNSGNTLSTHHVRLMNRIDDARSTGKEAQSASGTGFHAVRKINDERSVNEREGLPEVKAPTAGLARIARRRMLVPTCCWAGCGRPTESNVPYCEDHAGKGKMLTTWR